jgi:4-nitrophenyl phosphatase
LEFENIRGIVADMDGVLWRGTQPLAGLKPFFDMLYDMDAPFMLATNNSSKSPAQYVEKLRGMGIETVAEENIVNSGLATANFLLKEYPIGADVHVLGGVGLFDVVREAGFSIVEKNADVVVAGLDFDVTYDKVARAALEINAGARFIGTNADPSYPSQEGNLPGAGSLLAMLQTATGVSPEVVGKPHAPMFAYALDKMGTQPEETLMIGDRLTTDIEGGINVGMKTALVFTGVTTPDMLVESDIQPDVAYESLEALVKAWNYTGGKRRR